MLFSPRDAEVAAGSRTHDESHPACRAFVTGAQNALCEGMDAPPLGLFPSSAADENLDVLRFC